MGLLAGRQVSQSVCGGRRWVGVRRGNLESRMIWKETL